MVDPKIDYLKSPAGIGGNFVKKSQKTRFSRIRPKYGISFPPFYTSIRSKKCEEKLFFDVFGGKKDDTRAKKWKKTRLWRKSDFFLHFLFASFWACFARFCKNNLTFTGKKVTFPNIFGPFVGLSTFGGFCQLLMVLLIFWWVLSLLVVFMYFWWVLQKNHRS